MRQRNRTTGPPRRLAGRRLVGSAAPAVLVALLALTLLATGPAPVHAMPVLIYQHAGSADPALEGFNFSGGNSTVFPLNTALDPAAWAVDDDATVPGPSYYWGDTSAHAVAAADGWVLRASIRVDAANDLPDCSVFLETSVNGQRFYLGFGSVDGQTFYLQNTCGGTGTAIADPDPSSTTHPTSYHAIEISFDPDVGPGGAADVYVDGYLQPAASGWVGVTAPWSRTLFGANHGAGVGQGNYAHFEWEVGAQACRNGVDDDGDGLTDFAGGDPECESAADPSENPECGDGVDNDMDGDVDFPDDLGCETAADPSEDPQCDDGIDNDGDGEFDFPDDPECDSADDVSEFPECADGLNNDGDTFTDFPDDFDCESSDDDTEGPVAPAQCDDGIDNDGDGLVDALDPQCVANGKSESVIPLPLAYNFNGMLHAGESGAPSTTGYRSISDRGLWPASDPLLAAPFVDGPYGLLYALESQPDVVDLVHLGNRNTVDGSSKPLGVLPAWLPDPDQTGPQASSFSPRLLGADDAIGILYQISNGGGEFDVSLGFTSGSPVTVTVHGPDWFAPFNGQPNLPLPGVASQRNIGPFFGVGGVDLPVASSDLLVTEAIISVDSLFRGGLGNVAGRELESITISNRSNADAGYALLAASTGIPLVGPPTLPIPIASLYSPDPPELDREEVHLIDESGLSRVEDKLVESAVNPNGQHWNTLTETTEITFDLGQQRTISSIHIWNFNDGFGNNDFGPETIDLLVSNVGTSAADADFSGSPVLVTLPISEATGNTLYLGENYRFSGTTEADVPRELGGVFHDHSEIQLSGRFVRFANLDGSPSFGGRTGLSEVRFYELPEPAVTTSLLAGLVALHLLERRRSRS